MDLRVAPQSRAGLAAGIDAVVFDLGGVLIDWNPRHLYRNFCNALQLRRDLASLRLVPDRPVKADT